MIKDQNYVSGLRERLAQAKTPEDITKLLGEASTYTCASEKTRRAWKNTADRRMKYLGLVRLVNTTRSINSGVTGHFCSASDVGGDL